MAGGSAEGERSSNTIVICYRRGDSAGSAGRLYDNLCHHFGKSKVFMDVDAIPAGAEFVEYIVGVISNSDVLLAVIGPHWQELKGVNGLRKLDDESDVVRLEIQTALAKQIQIVPILVDAATMPTVDTLPQPIRAFARINALEITHRRFADGVAELVNVIEMAIADATRRRSQEYERGLAEKPYGAFLLYSHSADSRLANSLQNGLQTIASLGTVCETSEYFGIHRICRLRLPSGLPSRKHSRDPSMLYFLHRLRLHSRPG
jgi:hypothetical protein